MEKLWRYQPVSGFTTKNAGFSMWCFGTYDGKEYFIKQFLSPKYPADDQISSPEKIARKKKACEEFEQRRRNMYAVLSDASDGNDVRIESFFRVKSRYYIATEKIDALPWTVETIAAQEEGEKRRLCALVVHAIAALHKKRLVHSDIKHDNILYAYTKTGTVVPKVIDFDGSFLESNPPSMEDGVTGDANYFSPEVCARAYGEERPLSCKLDIFALGVLIHQYFSGTLPGYNSEECSCPGDAVLKGMPLQVSEAMPEDIQVLVGQMLSADPQARPDALAVMNRILQRAQTEEAAPSEEKTAAEEAPAEESTEDTAQEQPEIEIDAVNCPRCGNLQSTSMRFCIACGCRIREESGEGKPAPKKFDDFFFQPKDLL